MTRLHPLIGLLLAAPLAFTGCAGGSALGGQSVSLTAFKAGSMIEGVAKAPSRLVQATLIANNGSGLLTDNGGGLVSNNSGSVVANNTGRFVAAPPAHPTQGDADPLSVPYSLFALKDEVPLPEAVVYLSDPKDNFFRLGGKPITAVTDRNGTYRFQGGIPRGVPVIVSAVLNGNKRLVGFTVPNDGTAKVNLSVASTYVTEFLRNEARVDGKSMADYDLAKLADLTATTQSLLEGGELGVPDLEVAAIPDMTREYALVVGKNQGGLGDAWAELLGHRVLAMFTVAGTGEANEGGDGGAAVAAGLYRPRAAVADKFGHLYLADEGNKRVRKVDAKTGVITTFAGTGRGAFGGDGGPATDAHLNDPRAVALDAAGNLFIADQLNCRIRKVDATTGRIETIAGNPAPDGAGGWIGLQAGDGGQAKLARFYAPRGLIIDSAGDLFVVDSEKDTKFHVVRKIDMKSGLISTVVGTTGAEGGFAGDGGKPDAAKLNYPNQIAFDTQGRMLIADTQNHCIRRVDFTGKTIATIAGKGGNKGDDPDGRPATETRLDTPYGVAVGPDGRIYFSERGPGRVRAIMGDGTCKTVAGGGSDVRDGEARAVKLTQPHDLWVEPGGDLLVADTRGSRVRRVVTRFGL